MAYGSGDEAFARRVAAAIEYMSAPEEFVRSLSHNTIAHMGLEAPRVQIAKYRESVANIGAPGASIALAPTLT